MSDDVYIFIIICANNFNCGGKYLSSYKDERSSENGRGK